MPPSGCIRVTTDEGVMWAIERDRVITPTLRELHTWEPETIRCLSRHTLPGMSVMDVGANIGYVVVLSAGWSAPLVMSSR